MKKTRKKAKRNDWRSAEFDDWRKRYDAAIAAYEAMAERRRERKLLKRAQAKRDAALRLDDEIDRRWLETHPADDPITAYLRHRMAASALAWQFLSWTVSSAGNVVMASVAVRTLRRLATKSINHAEKLLWRTKKRVELPADTRSEAERERRKIRRRSTLSSKPSPDDVRKAWLAAGDSCRGIVAFGAMIHDLECYVDNSLAFDEGGGIVGRAAGVLGWIRENVPELAVRYKTIMRYKSIAKRGRQFLGLVDPAPLDPDDPRLASLLADCPATQKDVRERLDEEIARQVAMAKRSAEADKRRKNRQRSSR